MATFVNDFVLNFYVFVNLSIIVCNIVIRDIKNIWITCEIDEFGLSQS